ncbi:hypothetical protein GCM10027613_22160 [Microlunatus endophyticus]
MVEMFDPLVAERFCDAGGRPHRAERNAFTDGHLGWCGFDADIDIKGVEIGLSYLPEESVRRKLEPSAVLAGHRLHSTMSIMSALSLRPPLALSRVMIKHKDGGSGGQFTQDDGWSDSRPGLSGSSAAGHVPFTRLGQGRIDH